MHRLKKTLLIAGGIIITLVILVILFISPIAKYAIEKYDEKYTGRQIQLDLAYVNPFTGYIHLKNLKIFEYQSDSIFFSVDGFSVNIEIWKLFSKKYEISDITLNQPYAIIIQTKNVSNFDDLIKKFATPKDTLSEPVQFVVGDFQINDGEFHYLETEAPIKYFIKDFNLNIPGISWDSDSVSGDFDFKSGPGTGDVNGDFTLNLPDKRYRLDLKINQYDLNLIEQYLKELTNYGTLRATIDVDMHANGSYDDTEDFSINGKMAVNDFHFGKKPTEDYASFEKLRITVTEISPKHHILHGDSVILNRPYFKYEKYDYLDNIQTMFGKDGQNIDAVKSDSAKFNLILEIADYIKQLSKYFFLAHYKINRFEVNDADIRYNDYSMSEKFSIDLNPLRIVADSIDKKRPWLHLRLGSGIKPYGIFQAGVTINPKDSSDFDMEYNLEKLPLSMFNPYLISLSSFPFDRGTIEFKGKWNVRNGKIESNNHLIVIDPRIAKRLRNKEMKFLPMRSLMAIVRERGNVIDYDVPVTGNLDDPKFHIRDVIGDVFENIFVKPVKTGYTVEVRQIETEIEKSLSLKWPMRQSTLLPSQERFIEKIAEFLKDNPTATISIYPQLFEQKEKEYILFFEAKKKYYLIKENKQATSFNEQDSAIVEKMSIKDDAFVKYVTKQANDSLKFTMQEKCVAVIDSNRIKAELNQLNEARKNIFYEYFKSKNIGTRVKIHDEHVLIPFNGFSFYKISYNGEFPASILKAYDKMGELNEEAPRKKYKEKREKNIPLPEVNPNTSTK